MLKLLYANNAWALRGTEHAPHLRWRVRSGFLDAEISTSAGLSSSPCFMHGTTSARVAAPPDPEAAFL